MFLFMALNQVVLCSVQPTTSGIGHRVKYNSFFGLPTNTLNEMLCFLCFLFPIQQTTSEIGHRVKYHSFFRVANQYAECEKQHFSLNSNNKLMYHKKCYVSFHGAQGVLLYHRKQTQNSPNQRAHRVFCGLSFPSQHPGYLCC